MFSYFTKSLSKIFGTKSERDLKELRPYLDKVNIEYAKLSSVDADTLRAKTAFIQQKIAESVADIDKQINELNLQGRNSEGLSLAQKENIFAQIDKLELDRNKKIEEELLEQLPLAFAVIRETARRFKENDKIIVKTTEADIAFATTKPYITINNNTTTFSTTWPVRNIDVKWDMVHYDVQIIGGVVLHLGKIAEMATGEGKTLVATLPAFLNALANRGVHIVTVNDYLAKRDSEWMGPLFEFHGLSVDCIDKHEPHSPARRKAYQSHITYGTNNEFGFDYLRDNMAHETAEQVQRKQHYAMVDEIDSILIDDARTPLIISGPIPRGGHDQEEFNHLKPRIARLVEEQKKLINEYLNDAKRKLAAGNDKDAGLPLFRSYRGLPKYKPLIKFLSEQGNKTLLQRTENIYLQDNQRLMPEADAPLLFIIDEKSNSVNLTDKGLEFITSMGEDKQFFIMPDLSIDLDAIDKDTNIDNTEKAKRKDELVRDYTLKSHRIHSVNQLLKAYTLFERDVEYIIEEGKVKIVDEQTGRVLDGRRYSDGLHQAIEAKENVKIENATQTYATITLQNYFRMYHKLAGMTGTAETEAGEFWEIYKLDVVVVPTNRNIVRDDREDLVYRTTKEKYNAVVEEVNKLREAGRPVLVGTTSVENSELISRMLQMRKVPHQVLNAKQHQKEAEIVANAGKSGAVTIATNMAGRGTDIKLSPEAKQAGGLAIIGTERHESRRVDRQLRGRAGRQGDPGSSQFFVSLEDNLMRLFGSERIPKLMDSLGIKMEEGEVIQHSIITKSIERAQKKVEENNFGIRKRLLEYDDIMNYQREVIYRRRKNALEGDRLELDIQNMIFEFGEEIVKNHKGANTYFDFKIEVLSSMGFETLISQIDFEKKKEEDIIVELFREAIAHYRNKVERIANETLPVIKRVHDERGGTVENIVVPFTDGSRGLNVPVPMAEALSSDGKAVSKTLEKISALSIIDSAWMEHLREMDDLKQSVQNVSYEQKDPLLIYKFEALNLFKGLISKVNSETVSFLTRAGIPLEAPNRQVREPRGMQRPAPRLNTNRADSQSQSVEQTNEAIKKAAAGVYDVKADRSPIRSEKKYGRNDRITVQYTNGEVKADVKYKTVEQDLLEGKCVLVEEI